jgi:glutathione synthase/RimK-type ligase-like ATP-grasp enzyme
MLYEEPIEKDDVAVFLEVSPYGLYEKLQHECRIINKDYFDSCKKGKFDQTNIIKKAGLNYIPTYTIDNINELTDDVFVEKPMIGSLGKGVRLLSSRNNLKKSCIYQKYIPNEAEWRVIVINHKAVSMIRKKRQGNKFVNNLAQGGLAWPEWNDDVAKYAVECSKSLNIEYCGIDIIKSLDDGKYYFLESNSASTYETSQLVTGINISDIFVRYIIDKYDTKKIIWTKDINRL